MQMQKLVLFDIDGTLIWTHGAGRSAIRDALHEEMGAEAYEHVRFDGKTDPLIVRELLAAAGHPDAENPDRVEAVCARYLSLLGAELETRSDSIEVLPGVHAILDALEKEEGTVLGLLTGNLERGAFLKLSAAGIDPGRFRVGAYG